jgi:Dyp-type peroxidase family
MKQHGLTVIANIKQGHADALRRVLGPIGRDLVHNGLIDFTALTTVHYATWLILPVLPDKPSRLLFETNYDFELDAHLDDLLLHGRAAIDAIYSKCEGYPGAEASAESIKNFLMGNRISTSAYYRAFPWRSLAEINNAIKVYEEAQRFINAELQWSFRYVDPNGKQQSRGSGFEQLTRRQVQDQLVHHFRRSATNLRPGPPAPGRRLRLAFNWVLAAGRLIANAIIVVPVARMCELAEARNRGGPKTDYDPTEHGVDARTYVALDTDLQNHLCTFKTLKRSRSREFILNRVLSVTDFFCRKIYIFSRLGELSTIHFARWLVIDGEGSSGAQQSNQDKPSAGEKVSGGNQRSDKRLLFTSDYDGSFTSYLSDFSELAWYGLNPIWSNTVGFPPTIWLFAHGASDLERFEEGDRKHFYPAQVFYHAYSGYPVRNIRKYLDFSDELARNIEAAERKERRQWRAEERAARRGKRMVERQDLQGIVDSGYNHLNHARFIFLEIADAQQARQWLGRVVNQVSTARRREALEKKPATCLNIGFTSKGLEKLALPQETLGQFPYEFVAGMNRIEAARALGDTGASGPENWQFGSGRDQLDVMVLLFASGDAELNGLERRVFDADGALHRIACVDSQNEPGDRTEPFGFRDGISQPTVMSLTHSAPARADDLLRPGEFVLGYENEYGKIARSPSVAGALDHGNVLLPHPDDPKNLKSFGLNGSFLVARKLSQDVDGFWQFVTTESANLDRTPDPERRELLAAKMMGRWRSGAPLVLAKDHDVPVLGRYALLNNNFRYHTSDPGGRMCPIGSHIRRANPRDDVKFKPPALLQLPVGRKSLKLSKHHRIIRRGRRYLDTALSPQNPNGRDEGVLFIAINADLHRQFEFMQQTWLNNPTFQGLDNDIDPVVGNNDGTAGFTVQGEPCDQRVNGLPRFVSVKGGGYFFLPAIRALRFLASLSESAMPGSGATNGSRSASPISPI